MLEEEVLTKTIIGCAMRVHRVLGPGFLESVYESALAHKLGKTGLEFACQHPVQISYDGVVVGNFVADMVIENRVIVENKAVSALTRAHEVQLVHYLTATGIEIGLLLNFGAPSLEFKRKHRTFRKPSGPK